MTLQKRRVVLCMGLTCNAHSEAQALYDRLREHLGNPLPPFMARGRPVTWEIATCLDMCGQGPNLMIYPDEVCFNHLDPDTLEQVIQDYLTP